MTLKMKIFRLNVGNKVFLATWKMLSQHTDTKDRKQSGIRICLRFSFLLCFLKLWE